MKSKRYYAAGGLVVRAASADHGWEALLLDRPSRDEVRLPKGHIDAGESAAEAALRETREEAGYADLEIVDDLGEIIVEFDHEGMHYVRHEHYFLMRLRSERQIPRSKHDAQQFSVRWVPLAQASAALTYSAEQERAEQAQAAVIRWQQRTQATG